MLRISSQKDRNRINSAEFYGPHIHDDEKNIEEYTKKVKLSLDIV